MYRSAFWEARLSYWRWKFKCESQEAYNFPESHCCHFSEEELWLSDPKVATASKTMPLMKTENKYTRQWIKLN